MNHAFLYGAAIALFAELLKLIFRKHRLSDHHFLWTVAIMLPSFLAFSFLAGAAVEWLTVFHLAPQSMPSSATIIICTGLCLAIWLVTFGIERTLETKGPFVTEAWESTNPEDFCRRCALLYAASLFLSLLPYVLFSEVLHVPPFSNHWVLLAGGVILVTLMAYHRIRTSTCPKMRAAELKEARQVTGELLEYLVQDSLSAVNVDQLDRLLNRKMVMVTIDEKKALHLIGELERAIRFAMNFAAERNRKIIPGLADIDLNRIDLLAAIEKALTEKVEIFETRIRVLKLCYGDDAQAAEAEALLRTEDCIYTAHIDRFKSLRAARKKGAGS